VKHTLAFGTVRCDELGWPGHWRHQSSVSILSQISHPMPVSDVRRPASSSSMQIWLRVWACEAGIECVFAWNCRNFLATQSHAAFTRGCGIVGEARGGESLREARFKSRASVLSRCFRSLSLGLANAPTASLLWKLLSAPSILYLRPGVVVSVFSPSISSVLESSQPLRFFALVARHDGRTTRPSSCSLSAHEFLPRGSMLHPGPSIYNYFNNSSHYVSDFSIFYPGLSTQYLHNCVNFDTNMHQVV